MLSINISLILTIPITFTVSYLYVSIITSSLFNNCIQLLNKVLFSALPKYICFGTGLLCNPGWLYLPAILLPQPSKAGIIDGHHNVQFCLCQSKPPFKDMLLLSIYMATDKRAYVGVVAKESYQNGDSTLV